MRLAFVPPVAQMPQAPAIRVAGCARERLAAADSDSRLPDTAPGKTMQPDRTDEQPGRAGEAEPEHKTATPFPLTAARLAALDALERELRELLRRR
jgi:hypothetical protein